MAITFSRLVSRVYRCDRCGAVRMVSDEDLQKYSIPLENVQAVLKFVNLVHTPTCPDAGSNQVNVVL